MNMLRRNRDEKSIESLQAEAAGGIDWSARAVPEDAVDMRLRPGSTRYVFALADIAADNQRHLARKRAEQHGMITGYAGMAAATATLIAAEADASDGYLGPAYAKAGFPAVSAWDLDGVHQAVRAAERVADDRGESGRILEIAMIDPIIDPDGYLLWHSPRESAQLMAVYDLSDFAVHLSGLGRTAIFDPGRMPPAA